MKKAITIRIDTELLNEARFMAKKEIRSLTSFIEISVKERIEKLKKVKN